MNITVRIPLRTNKRKREKIEKAIEKEREVAEFASNRIMSIPKKKWGNKLTELNHILRNRFPNNNGLYYMHYLYKLGYHISDIYSNWMKDGFPGEKPDFSDMDYFTLCNCGSNELAFEENDGKWGVQIPLLKEGEKKDWFRLRTGEYQENLLSEYKIKDNSKIVKKGERYELHQPVEIPDRDLDYELKTFIGVDFNFDRMAVATIIKNGEHKETEFFDRGKELNHYRKRITERKKELQEKGLNKRVEELKDQESRFVRQILHTTSKKIIDMASNYENPVIRIEDTGIQNMRKDVNKYNKNWFKTRINKWPVAQLKDFIEYKAEKRGIKLEKVDPRDTSKKCNKCGEKGIRPYKNNQKRFYCKKCSYECDADFNAAKNIALVG